MVLQNAEEVNRLWEKRLRSGGRRKAIFSMFSEALLGTAIARQRLARCHPLSKRGRLGVMNSNGFRIRMTFESAYPKGSFGKGAVREAD